MDVSRLVIKTDFDAKLTSLNAKITSNKSFKYLRVENELKILEKFDAAYFRGKIYFDGDGTQNYLVFQPVYKYFRVESNNISSWESKGLSNEKVSIATFNNNNNIFATSLIYLNARLKVKFNGNFLKQDTIMDQ